MKKLKLICSAIVAFSVLALAGCDLELPDSAKVHYNTGATIYDTGVATASEWGDSLVVGFSPMYGKFSYTTYNGETVKIDNAEVTGANAWWTDRVDSQATSIADGETVTINLQCTEGSVVALCMHVHNDAGWWWYNPGDGNFWGDDSLKATYDKTYTMSGARNLSEGIPYTFTITRSGSELTWSFKTISNVEEAEEDD